ncbi:hypothetical protein K7X08_008913 [Anisodus acutangulus]|uniref:DNA repair protein REV1 n=1 Tax=Anisodus acutangulus TaxID=402998 RepID=A0A9Q1MYB8_9SOLA|nr:hypothetical protein K7X08_008913 [Anisodus acutangulus]
MARLATRIAKPDGQCYIPAEKVEEHLCELPVKTLPGIGHVLEEKLNRKQITICGQLRMISKKSKSIGADVNWGVTFKDLKDVHHFLLNLCKEVSLRLQGCGVIGRKFTLKIKKRRGDAGEPVKYLGCGVCDNLSHSVMVPMATDSVDVLERIVSQLFTTSHVDVEDIRGMGLQVSKLETADSSKQDNSKNSGDERQAQFQGDSSTPFIEMTAASPSVTAGIGQRGTLPPMNELDIGVIVSSS